MDVIINRVHPTMTTYLLCGGTKGSIKKKNPPREDRFWKKKKNVIATTPNAFPSIHPNNHRQNAK